MLSTEQHRLIWVDVLRGTAVLLVLFRHIHLESPKSAAGFLYRALYFLQTGGGVGVDLFFVISGFLVSGILFRQFLKTGRIQPVRFLIRRGFKIYPPFWVFIATTLIWIWITQRRLPLLHAIAELAFVQNYYSGLYSHTWSLGVEEHCYIGICICLTILAFVSRRRQNPLGIYPVFAVTLAIAALLLRSQDVSPITASNFWERIAPTHLRGDAFLVGSLLGYSYYFYNQTFLSICQRFRFALFVVGVVWMLPAFFTVIETTSGYRMWFFWLVSPGAAMMLMSALGTQASPGMISRMIAIIGRHSYSIYLWHILAGVLWLDLLFARLKIPVAVLTWVPAYFAVSILFGVMMTYLVEIPSLRLRDRWFPENRGARHAPAINATTESPLSLDDESWVKTRLS